MRLNNLFTAEMWGTFGRFVFCLASFSTLEALHYSPFTVVFFSAIVLIYLVHFRRLNYLDPLVAFCLPWLVVLVASRLDISDLWTELHAPAYRLIFLVLFAAIVASKSVSPSYSVAPLRFRTLFHNVLLMALTALNIALAGYVPLIRGIQTGDPEYLTFGVHGLYGFYLAYMNAYAILCFYAFLTTKENKFL